MDVGASASLLEWVSSFGESFSSLKDLHDARHLLYLIKHMQQDQSEGTEAKSMSEECVSGNFWDQVKQYLGGSNYRAAAESINYEDAESGVELEIAKIVMLLLSLSIMCPNHPKIKSDMTNLSNETQWGIRFILIETLDEDKSPNADIFEVLQRKAVCDQDGESAISMSSSPAKSSGMTSFLIKIRDLNQKNSILRKNLHAARVAREESDKLLIEKESLIEDLEHEVRDLTRKLFEIDELHELRQQRDTLERENAILKHRIEKFDAYAQESKDLKKILDSQYERNDDLSKQVKSLQTSLARMEETSRDSTVLEDSLKALLPNNSLLEEELSEVTMQLRLSQNMEQKEYYESQTKNTKHS